MQHFIYFLVKLLIESTVTFASILGGIGAFIAGITGLFAVFLAYKSFMKVENELKEQKDQITELANIAKGLTKQNELSEKRFELSILPYFTVEYKGGRPPCLIFKNHGYHARIVKVTRTNDSIIKIIEDIKPFVATNQEMKCKVEFPTTKINALEIAEFNIEFENTKGIKYFQMGYFIWPKNRDHKEELKSPEKLDED